MSQPIRIQRKRTKGFNLQAQSPDGRQVVSVCRPGKWGNGFKVVQSGAAWAVFDVSYVGNACWFDFDTKEEATLWSVQSFVTSKQLFGWGEIEELRGKHLACFCEIGSPCHADELLKEANK